MLYFFICLLTIFIACQDNLLYSNITGVSNIPSHHTFVMLYTIICALFFAYKMHKIYHKLIQDKKIYHIVINTSALIMILGSFFRYTQNSKDIFSLLHVYCSMIGSLSFLVLLFIYTRLLSYQNPLLYRRVHFFFDFGLNVLIIFTIVFTKINGIIEILFVIVVCLYMYKIEKCFLDF